MNDRPDPGTAADHDDGATAHQVDRHTDDQPARDDLLDPERIDADADDLDAGAGAVDDPDPFHRDDEPPRAGTDPELLPESQGFGADEVDRLTEDAGVREPLHDER